MLLWLRRLACVGALLLGAGVAAAQEEADEPWPAEPEPEADASPPPSAPDAGVPEDASGAPAPRAVSPQGHRTEETGPIEAPRADLEWLSVARESDVIASLESRMRLLEAGDVAGADLELTHLQELRDALGVRNVPLASAALVHEAGRSLAAGQVGRAKMLADAARILSPDMLAAHWMRLEASFASDRLAAGAFLSILLEAGAAKVGGFRNRANLFADVGAILLLALLAVAVIYAVIQGMKHVRCLGHDLARLLPSWVSDLQVVLAILVLWIAPLGFGLGLAFAVAFVIASVAPYQTRRERIVGGSVVLLTAAIPGLVYLGAPLLAFHGSVVEAISVAASESPAAGAERDLIALSQARGGGDLEVAMALAHRAQARGDMVAAERWLGEALAVRPDSAAVRNNLGKVRFLVRRTEDALASFRQAAAPRTHAEPWLNIASVLLDQSFFDEARSAIDEARAIDPELARRYNALDTGTSTAKKLLEVPFDYGALWGRLFAVDAAERMAITEGLWRRTGSRLAPSTAAVVTLALGLLGFVMAARRNALRVSRPCESCGIPVRSMARTRHCEQCESLFLKASMVDLSMRISKERKTWRYQERLRWTERLLGFVAGAADMFAGRPIIGTVTLFFFSASVIGIAWVKAASVDAMAVWTGSMAMLTVPLGTMALLFLVLSLRRAFGR